MNSCKSLSVDKSDNLDLINKYYKRLNFATAANKTRKVTIEKLKEEIKAQDETNKNLSTKLDRAVQLCNTRQILIKKLKDDLNKMKAQKLESDATNQALVDEIYELRYNSKIKLSATQEELMMLSSKNQEEQIELDQRLEELQTQLNKVKGELRLKEAQIAEFVNSTKKTVCEELNNLSKTVEEGSYRLKMAEEKTKELCKGVIFLLTMFYKRKIARRLVSDKVALQNSSAINKSSKQDKKKKTKDKDDTSLDESGDKVIPSDTQLKNNNSDLLKEATDEILKNLDKTQINSSTVTNLKEVIRQFHIIIHKRSFATDLGQFLFNKIVLPYTDY